MRLDDRKKIQSLKSACSTLHAFKAHVLLPLEGNNGGITVDVKRAQKIIFGYLLNCRPINDSAAVTFPILMIAVANVLLKSVCY